MQMQFILNVADVEISVQAHKFLKSRDNQNNLSRNSNFRPITLGKLTKLEENSKLVMTRKFWPTVELIGRKRWERVLIVWTRLSRHLSTIEIATKLRELYRETSPIISESPIRAFYLPPALSLSLSLSRREGLPCCLRFFDQVRHGLLRIETGATRPRTTRKEKSKKGKNGKGGWVHLTKMPMYVN